MRTGRRTRPTAAMVTAAAVLLTGFSAVLLFHGHALNGRRRPVAIPPATSRPGSNPASAALRAPRATAIDAAGLRWIDFHGIQLPVSAAGGPADMRGGLASGFTDARTGAVLAAINIGVRTAAQWGPAIFQPTITRQVTGPDAAVLLNAQEAAYRRLRAAARVRAGQPVGRGYAAEVAYRLITYTPADATVDVVTAGPGSHGTTVLAVTRVQVAWRGGDWRVVAPPRGDWGNVATTISSLTGYTTFPGEG